MSPLPTVKAVQLLRKWRSRLLDFLNLHCDNEIFRSLYSIISNQPVTRHSLSLLRCLLGRVFRRTFRRSVGRCPVSVVESARTIILDRTLAGFHRCASCKHRYKHIDSLKMEYGKCDRANQQMLTDE